MFASNADKAVVQAASTSLASVPGVTVSPAKCDGTSLVSGSTVLGGDSSAVSSSDKGTVVNDGNGGGNYSNTTSMESIINNGDGTATVNGATVKDAPKVEKVGKLGKFPPVESLKPVESCGTVITLEDGVLFDFGKSDIRPDAAQTLKSLAGVLNNAKVPTAHIYGHTDSISDEAFNLQLSQERADAVSAELKKDGVSATLDTTGYGESKPVVPNENADGSDNPTGRALNSRVEQPAHGHQDRRLHRLRQVRRSEGFRQVRRLRHLHGRRVQRARRDPRGHEDRRHQRLEQPHRGQGRLRDHDQRLRECRRGEVRQQGLLHRLQ